MNAGSLLSRIWGELGGDPRALDDVTASGNAVPLRSRLAIGELAWTSVAAATLVAGGDPSVIDPERVSVAYRSDRALTIDGTAPPVWSPFSGFWETADGWIRTHGNYPHHAAALRAALGLTEAVDADRLRDVILGLSAVDAVSAITSTGGLAVPVIAEDPDADARLRQQPLLDIRRLNSASTLRMPRNVSGPLPLSGMRVLDLTRVIAGPVCTRTLALLGADVLRIDPPDLPEPEWQHVDTGHGKRTALLDARSPRMQELLAGADAVVLGYRPAALDRLGLTPEALAQRHPGLVIAQLSAWGTDRPEHAGFDSLVQAESGIALVESADGTTPGALPAQALDHSAGYLLAAAITTLLRRREVEGGTWFVHTSLRRIAGELLGMPRRARLDPAVPIDEAAHIARFVVAGHELTTSRPALPGREFAAPRPWGGDQPRW
ncbi:CoA transferase [Microbacterium sp. PMB16]|uniref:CoA transferase n=1 Tax=Microbacterium sp. PMB16 TaxID=3120157 RepID=UPI003F4C1A87